MADTTHHHADVNGEYGVDINGEHQSLSSWDPIESQERQERTHSIGGKSITKDAAAILRWTLRLRAMDSDYSLRSTHFDGAIDELIPALAEVRTSNERDGSLCILGSEVLWQLIIGHAHNKERMASKYEDAVKYLCDEVALAGEVNHASERRVVACMAIGSLAYTNPAGARAAQTAVPDVVALLVQALEGAESNHDEEQMDEHIHAASGTLWHLAAHGAATSITACANAIPYLTRVVTRRPMRTTQTTASLALASAIALSEDDKCNEFDEAAAATAILALVRDSCFCDEEEKGSDEQHPPPPRTVPLSNLIWLTTKPLLPLLTGTSPWRRILGAAVAEAVARDESPRASPVALLWCDGVADVLMSRQTTLSKVDTPTDEELLETKAVERAICALGVLPSDDALTLSGESASCPICFEMRSTWCQLQPCNHCVCARCASVMRASNNHLRCPLCRAELM